MEVQIVSPRLTFDLIFLNLGLPDSDWKASYRAAGCRADSLNPTIQQPPAQGTGGSKQH